MGHWFYDNKTPEQQIEYCQNLKGGKKSKFCDISTKMPIPRQASESKPSAENKENKNSSHSYYDAEGEYAWAKKSQIKNIGEDIEDSARHRRNEHRDWGSIDDMSSNADFTKDDLVRLHKIETDKIKQGHAAAYWVIHEVMKKFPSEERFRLSPESKKRWINKYQEFLKHGYSIAEADPNPISVAGKFTTYLKAQVESLAGPGGDYDIRYFCSMVMHDSFYTKTGFLERLKQGLKIQGYKRKDELCLEIGEKFNQDSMDEKFRNILDGKPFLSTMTGEKKEVEKFSEASVYNDIVPERLAINVFNTVKESEDFLVQKVGLKGVQFGNSLTDTEKAEHLGRAAHAFYDMGKALDIDPKYLSLNGELSMGFGSRGIAGSRATYFPEYKFFNINRRNGYGTLAHEWSHGLGYYFGEMALTKSNPNIRGKACISNLRKQYFNNSPELFELRESINAVSNKVLKRVESDERFRKLDTKFRTWVRQPQELFARAFENYVAKKLQEKEIRNGYLVNKMDHFAWPNDEETSEYTPYFDRLFEILKTSAN